jgi:micrococcal nuclease
VVDGDTIIVNGHERVRLIGVDTPEYYYSDKLVRDSNRSGKDMSIIMALGKVASMFTKHEILGQKVRLEYEWQRNDRYGRTLAYVFRQPDNFFLNAEIIKQGYGNAYTRFPFKYLEEFRRYEREARERKKGLWADNRLEGL